MQQKNAYWLGGSWKHKTQIWISWQAYPIPIGYYNKKHQKFKFLGGREVLPLDSKNIQRKLWKIQRKNQETEYFSFWPYKQFCSISKKVCCIPEVLTHIEVYIHAKWQMSYTYICHKWHKWHIWHVCCSYIHHMYVCQYRCQKKR